jgi:hypothetical protein
MNKLHRVVAAGVVLTLGGMFGSTAAGAATPAGVGTTVTKTTVLDIQLGQGGNVLHLSVLGDHGLASIDSHTATPSAASVLAPLSVTSGLLHLNVAAPTIATQSPGGPTDASGQGLSLSSLGVPSVIATGTVKAAVLHSDWATGAAHASMSAAEVDNLSLVGGGLLSIDSLSSTLDANAIGSDADGSRAVGIGAVKVLDLGMLLKGLGIDPASLPVSALSSLLTAAGLPVPGLPTGATLSSYVDSLNATITSLRSTVNATLNQVTGTVDATTQGLLGSLGLTAPSLSSTVAQVNATIDQVQAKLVDILKNGLSALDGAPLVQIAPASVGITTVAGPTLADSSVGVNVAPLRVSVAGINLPVLDATSLTSVVNGALATANKALDTVLGTLGLPANLVSVSALDQAKSLTMNGSYTQAVAGITGLTVKVAAIDPSVITSAIGKLAGPSAASMLGSALSQVSLPATTAMGALNTLLNTVAPLTGGAQVQIASVSGSSTYTAAAPATTTNVESLPRTGGHPELALLGVLFTIGALGLVGWRRWVAVRS